MKRAEYVIEKNIRPCMSQEEATKKLAVFNPKSQHDHKPLDR